MQKGHFCPLIKKECVQHKCAWYVHLRGKNPQSEQEIDEYACAVAWGPILQVETAQRSHQTTANLTSFKEEMSKANQTNQQLLLAAAQMVVPPEVKLLDNKE